jgi:hypothetical protein
MSHGVSEQPALTHRDTSASDYDEKQSFSNEKASPPAYADEKGHIEPVNLKHLTTVDVGDVADDVRAIDLGADGKERPIETAEDYALRLLSLEDDPSLQVFTFRMWFLGLGLSCFGAVLGQLFYFRPQTISVSQLFIQVGYYACFSMDAALTILCRSSPTFSAECLSVSSPVLALLVVCARRTLGSGAS